MNGYPEISDSEFYEGINRIYKRFTIPKSKRTFEEICFPKKFQLQLPQEFLSQYINPKTPYKGVLIYHRIGAGKTCTAIRVAETWKKYRAIVVVLPASLKGNFRNELRSLCAGNSYLKESERSRLSELHPSDPEYKEIIKESDRRIDDVYSIYSYNKFIQLAQDKQINLRNTILIIDEIQNMVSEEGTYYNTLYNMIHDAPDDLRIVLLSATPMFDKPNEIALTMNLLRLPRELPTGREFYSMFVRIIKTKSGKYYYRVKNMDLFKDLIRGYVSYFRGAPPYVFPILTIRYVRCIMSDFQYQAYKDVIKAEAEKYHAKNIKKVGDIIAKKVLTVKNLPNNFFIGTRIVSNIVFPNRQINEEGFASFTGNKIRVNLYNYSTKFSRILTRVEKAKGKVFIYSGFKEYGGIKSLTRVLDEMGYLNYLEHGEGHKRYATWSGDENISEKDEIRAVYNRKDNLDGSKIKIILGSPATKEGISFTAIQQVHILEPYWNQSRLEQIIGRASRYCSHKDVQEEKRIVKVYIYVAVHPDEPETVDEYMQQLSVQKSKLTNEFEKAIKEAAIDCELNKNANVYEGEEDIQCVHG
jgi:superfamily II DNA or RNA helicase